MKKKTTISLLLMLVLHACNTNEKTYDNNHVKGDITKAYLNFHVPLTQEARRILFYECSVHNRSSEDILLKLPYDIHDAERNGNIYVKFSEHDSVNLYCRNALYKDFKVASGETRQIDLCIYLLNDLYKKSKMEDYHLFLDSLSFVTQEIIYQESDQNTLHFNKSKDYVMEHRLLKQFEAGEGYRE